MVADLMETCIDDVLRAPVVPTVTARDEAGPSNAYATPSVTGEDPVSLNGEAAQNLANIPPSEFRERKCCCQTKLIFKINLCSPINIPSMYEKRIWQINITH